MMRKVFYIKGLECAHCAEKMERAILKIKGVEDASINFMTQKLAIEVDTTTFEEVMKEVEKVVKKIESNVEIVEA